MFSSTIQHSFFFSEVVLGDHNINTDPDCGKKKCDCSKDHCAAPKITRKITSEDQIIVHENYDQVTAFNDIALIRLNEPVPLQKDDPDKSSVIPVCLPWSESDPGRNLEKIEDDEGLAILTGWGKISVKVSDTIRKQKFGVSVPILRRVALPIAHNICKNDPELEKFYNPEIMLCAGGRKGNIFIIKDSNLV